MSIVGFVLCIAFFFVGTVFNVMRSRQLWTGRTSDPISMVAFSIFTRSADVRRGMVRGTVSRALQTGLIGLFLVFALIAYDIVGSGRPAFIPWLLVALACMLLAIVAFVIQLFIIWFNRPKFLVPPPMRGDLGTVTARRAARFESSRPV